MELKMMVRFPYRLDDHWIPLLLFGFQHTAAAVIVGVPLFGPTRPPANALPH
jgi:hypothetical protein